MCSNFYHNYATLNAGLPSYLWQLTAQQVKMLYRKNKKTNFLAITSDSSQ